MIWAPFVVFVAVFLAMVVIGLILAPYNIWQEAKAEACKVESREHALKAEIETLKDNKPDLHLEVIQVATSDGPRGRDETLFVFFLQLVNRGRAPSAVMEWASAAYRDDGTRVKTQLEHIEFIEWSSDGLEFKLLGADELPEKTQQPVLPGAALRGHLNVFMRRSEVEKYLRDLKIKIRIKDVFGVAKEVNFNMRQAQPQRIVYYNFLKAQPKGQTSGNPSPPNTDT
ncbi:hypothetical protein FIV06_23800 [Labrenzia sp. THAF191b]|nr:hypothetical protein FIV06_23800 [Labrenzia sp. THAF191b]QFT06786.1 hypothetical protein FIV05_23795 [Labrenzia sp. THAF191a]QFT18330.1 hypothetical protein FIV03_23810 [Labrenzia sp. THAF187b]